MHRLKMIHQVGVRLDFELGVLEQADGAREALVGRQVHGEGVDREVARLHQAAIARVRALDGERVVPAPRRCRSVLASNKHSLAPEVPELLLV